MGIPFLSFKPFAQHEVLEGGMGGEKVPWKILKFFFLKSLTWSVLSNSVFSVVTTPTYKELSPLNSF